VAEITARGIPVFQGTCAEVYLEKAFDNTTWRPTKRLENAQKLGETSLMFLTHPTITDEQVERVCDVVGSVLAEAKK
jgi:dTDP-4-amino-4,6-dideoxygalactose transaminase